MAARIAKVRSLRIPSGKRKSVPTQGNNVHSRFFRVRNASARVETGRGVRVPSAPTKTPRTDRIILLHPCFVLPNTSRLGWHFPSLHVASKRFVRFPIWPLLLTRIIAWPLLRSLGHGSSRCSVSNANTNTTVSTRTANTMIMRTAIRTASNTLGTYTSWGKQTLQAPFCRTGATTGRGRCVHFQQKYSILPRWRCDFKGENATNHYSTRCGASRAHKDE